MLTLLIAASFLQASSMDPLSPSRYRAVDVDRDGRSDLFKVLPGRGVQLLRNEGGGRLLDRTRLLGLDRVERVEKAEWWDVDRDDWTDLVVLDADGVLSWFRNDGGKSFVEATLFDGARGREGIDWQWIALDDDDRLDLLVHTEDSCSVLIADEAGAFSLTDTLHFFRSPSAPDAGQRSQGAQRTAPNIGDDANTSAKDTGIPDSNDSDRGRSSSAGRTRGTPRAERVSGPGGGDGPPEGSVPGTGPITVDAENITPSCAVSLEDQASAMCLSASSVPVLGMLYPLGVELFIDSDGRVGLGTTSPANARLEVLADAAGDGIFVDTPAGAGTAIEAISSSVSDGFGIKAEANSPVGRAVRAVNEATTGNAIAVDGVTRSSTGRAVSGIATSLSGSTSGVFGQSLSPAGVGVRGTGAPGGVGVRGESDGGVAVEGEDVSTLGGTGVRGTTNNVASTLFAGVHGTTEPPSLVYNAGVVGEINAPNEPITNFFGSAVVGVNATGGWDALPTTAVNSGVFGFTDKYGGVGVYGFQHDNAPPGLGAGVYGTSHVEGGTGVRAFVQPCEGMNFGVYSVVQTPDTNATGVYGLAQHSGNGSTGGSTNGVWGETYSSDDFGTGVYGTARGTTGRTYGLFGQTDSTDTDAAGVRGDSYSGGAGVMGFSLDNHGVLGQIGSIEPATTAPAGVTGYSFVTPGNGPGVQGISEATGQPGVFGDYRGTSTGAGVRGFTSSPAVGSVGVSGQVAGPGGFAAGVLGEILDVTGNGIGVYGRHAGGAFGVYGECDDGWGVYGVSANGVAVHAEGDMVVNGALDVTGAPKNFVHPHPRDPSKEIRFTCLEGNESGTFFRGTARLDQRKAVIPVPEEFRLVTEQEGLTVQLTAVGRPAGLYVESQDLEQIVVRGDVDVSFHYFVNGIRAGFADHESIVENEHYVPVFSDLEFGAAFHPSVKETLVRTGVLTPDGLPNLHTAARLGWDLKSSRASGPPRPVMERKPPVTTPPAKHGVKAPEFERPAVIRVPRAAKAQDRQSATGDRDSGRGR